MFLVFRWSGKAGGFLLSNVSIPSPVWRAKLCHAQSFQQQIDGKLLLLSEDAEAVAALIELGC